MPRKFSEEHTRKEMIYPQLEHADWYLRDHSKVKEEIPVDGYDAESWNGVSDYCLYRENGEVLAVVEAKKTAQFADDFGRRNNEGKHDIHHQNTFSGTSDYLGCFIPCCLHK